MPPGRFEKRLALNEAGEAVQYVDIFRPSYLTYKYQSVTATILQQEQAWSDSAMKYDEMLSHEDCLRWAGLRSASR